MIEQPSQISLTSEIGGYVKFSVGITHPFRTHRENHNEPTIQLTTVESNQANRRWHSDWYYSHIGSLDSCTDDQSRGSRRNIYNRTGVNPQGSIGTIIPDTNSGSNWKIFDAVIRTSDLSYRNLSWHGAAKSESVNLGGNNILENSERKNNFEVEKVGRKNSVIYNHKDSDSIHADPNHSESNHIRSFNNSANISEI